MTASLKPSLRRRHVHAVWVLLLLVSAVAAPAPAAEPADGTILLQRHTVFDLDANSGDVVTSADMGPDGKLVIVGYAHDGAGIWTLVAARFDAYGQLDPTFGNSGRIVDPLSNVGFGYSTYGRAVKVLSDGRILIAGSVVSTFPGTAMVVLRLNANGTLDTTFGSSGSTLVTFGLFSTENDEANAMTLDRSGRIYLAGSIDIATGNRDMGVVRLTQSGQLDTTFGVGGKVDVSIDYSGPNLDLGFGVAVAPSGKIVVAGTSRYTVGSTTSFNLAVVQLLVDGELDPSFGAGGIHIEAFDRGGNSSDILRAVAVDEHDRIVVGGESTTSQAGVTDFLVERLLSNGDRDDSFHGSGVFFGIYAGCTPSCGQRDSVHSIALQGDGEIVVAGPSYSSATANYDFGFARLVDSGFYDNTFIGGGVYHVDWAGGGNDDDSAEAVLVGADGRLFVAGSYEHAFPDTDWGYLELANHLIFADGFEGGYIRHWSSHAN